MCGVWGDSPACELALWNRGVNIDSFTPARRSEALRTSICTSSSDIVLLWVGPLDPEKRPDIWFAVVKRLQDDGLPVKALLMNRDSLPTSSTYDLSHVMIVDNLSEGALGEALASGDILFMPGASADLDMVVSQSLSAGCPAIVGREHGGHLVDHGVNGFACQCDDAEGFYQEVRMLVQNVALRKQMSIAARETAWRFDRNIMLQKMTRNFMVSNNYYF